MCGKQSRCMSSSLTTMMAMRPPTSPTTVMGGFSLGINTGKKNEKDTEKVKKISVIICMYLYTAYSVAGHVGYLVCVSVCITWYLHAGVNGSSGLDGGWGVSAIYLV